MRHTLLNELFLKRISEKLQFVVPTEAFNLAIRDLLHLSDHLLHGKGRQTLNIDDTKHGEATGVVHEWNEETRSCPT